MFSGTSMDVFILSSTELVKKKDWYVFWVVCLTVRDCQQITFEFPNKFGGLGLKGQGKSVKKENLLLAKLNYHVKLLNKTQQKIEAVKTVLC